MLLSPRAHFSRLVDYARSTAAVVRFAPYVSPETIPSSWCDDGLDAIGFQDWSSLRVCANCVALSILCGAVARQEGRRVHIVISMNEPVHHMWILIDLLEDDPSVKRGMRALTRHQKEGAVIVAV